MVKKNPRVGDVIKTSLTSDDSPDVVEVTSTGVGDPTAIEFPTLKAINEGEELPAADPVVKVDAPELNVKELVKSVKDEFRKVENNTKEFKAPAESAMSIIDEAADKAEPITSDGGFNTDFEITKGTAERLANRLNEIPKNSSVDLKTLVEIVCDQVEKLHKEKARRSQQNTRTIASLRANDPKGIKTCGRCAYRVDITKMDSKKELCEVCSS